MSHFPPCLRLRRRRGLSFIELLIGLSISSVTCAILAVLIGATATGTSSQNDGRRNLVRLQSLKAVLEDEFVNARCILAAGNNYVVYWTGDNYLAVTPVNNAVNFSELRLLEVDASGNLKLHAAVWPAGSSTSTITTNDTTYPADTDWYAAAQSLRGTTYYGSTTLATGIAGMSVSLDHASAPAARLISLRIDVNDSGITRQGILTVALANPGGPW